MQGTKWLNDRGRQVGAASDRLGQDNIGLSVRSELLNRGHKVVELAAEAGAGDFAHVEALCPKRFGIDQPVGLVVRYQADFEAARNPVSGKASNGGRLASP